jgi:hypothetical protein
MFLSDWSDLMTPPEGHPGQHAYTFMIRILSTSASLTSISIFSVCCYSRYLSHWFQPGSKILESTNRPEFPSHPFSWQLRANRQIIFRRQWQIPEVEENRFHDIFANISVQKPAARGVPRLSSL